MKKNKILLLIIGSILLSFNSFGAKSRICYDVSCAEGGGRISFTKINKNQVFDAHLLNLKPISTAQNSVAKIQSGPITITQAQFQYLESAGNTWMGFSTSNDQISMNIGTANNSSPQVWTLPNDIFSVFKNYERKDFITLASLPNSLTAPSGTTHIIKAPTIDYDDFEGENYRYYNLSGTEITYLGEDYDFEGKADYDYDSEPDCKFVNVPLALNNSYSTTTELYNTSVNGSLVKEINAVTVDGYGTLATPDGTFDCLRVKYVVSQFRRNSTANTYPVSPTSTYTRLQWVAANGYVFEGTVVSENPTTHEATLSDIVMNKIVSTISLTETGDVKLNNDNKGVTINSLNEPAHPSAILDIKNDSLGVLIPRIAKANRPHSPATGLLVYQIDNTPGFYYFDGSGWRILGSSPSARILANDISATNSISENSIIRGKNQLSNGEVFIKFNQIQENPEDLNINLTLEGDCNGLYISSKTKEGFWVKELKGGKSNVKFSYSMKLN